MRILQVSVLSLVLSVFVFFFWQEAYSKGRSSQAINDEQLVDGNKDKSEDKNNNQTQPPKPSKDEKEDVAPTIPNPKEDSNEEKPTEKEKPTEPEKPTDKDKKDKDQGTGSNEKPKKEDPVSEQPGNQDKGNNKPKDNNNGNKKEKVVYLTFDDGPHYITIDILNLLDKYNAKATFFMLEPNMKTYKDTILEMVKRGHQLALHSVTHDKDKFYASKESVVGEMKQAQKTLEQITGIKTTLIRTPYGSSPYMKPEYKAAVKDAGFQMWDWNIDSLDWKKTDGSFVEYTIDQLKNLNTKEPIVILMHDRTTTVKHLEKLLSYLSKEGYEMKILTPDMDPVQFGKKY